MTNNDNIFFETFDETDESMTLALSDFDSDEPDSEIDAILRKVQRQKEAEEEALRDAFQNGFEKGYTEGKAEQQEQHTNDVNAMIDSLENALGSKAELLELNQNLAVNMMTAVIENCFPTLAHVTFSQEIKDIMFTIAQTATRDVELTVSVHPLDRSVMEEVIQSPKFADWTIHLREDDGLEQYTLKANWNAGEGGAVFDLVQTSQTFLNELKELLTSSLPDPSHSSL